MPKRAAPRTIGSEDSLARRVQREREKRGWSPAGLAERMTKAGCPMSQSAIWKIENGQPRRRITVDEAVAFADVFEVSFEDLLIHPDVADSERAVKLLRELSDLTEDFNTIGLKIEDAWSGLAKALGDAGPTLVERLRASDVRWSHAAAHTYFRKGMSENEVHEVLAKFIDAMGETQDDVWRRVRGEHPETS